MQNNVKLHKMYYTGPNDIENISLVLSYSDQKCILSLGSFNTDKY